MGDSKFRQNTKVVELCGLTNYSNNESFGYCIRELCTRKIGKKNSFFGLIFPLNFPRKQGGKEKNKNIQGKINSKKMSFSTILRERNSFIRYPNY